MMTSAAVGIVDVSLEGRHDIRQVLVERRSALLNEIQSRLRDVREEGSGNNHYTAHVEETFEAQPEDDLAFALIQMKAETLARVNEAVRRLDEGIYGYCDDCDDVISSSRLRAMPFAVRCRNCEEKRENEQRRERVRLQRVPSALGSRYASS